MHNTYSSHFIIFIIILFSSHEINYGKPIKKPLIQFDVKPAIYSVICGAVKFCQILFVTDNLMANATSKESQQLWTLKLTLQPCHGTLA